MNDQLHCGHICAAAFLAFSEGGQGDRGAKRERERERGGGKRETIMSAEDNALNTTFRDLGLSKQRRKTEKIEISM